MKIASFDCYTVPAPDGRRVELQLRSDAPVAALTLTLSPPLAERLANDLQCQCAATKGRPLGGTVPGYAADRARLHYDAQQGVGRIQFSARGEHGITIHMSLEALLSLRQVLEAVA